MTAWLDRSGFPGVSKHTVDRLMREEACVGWFGAARSAPRLRARTGCGLVTCSSATSTTAPNRAWVTDFT